MRRWSKVYVLLACVGTACLGFVGFAPGCANGNGEDELVDNLPRTDAGKDGTIKDTGGGGDGGGDDSGGGKDTGPPDTGPTCGDIGTNNTCETVTDLGSFALGSVKTFPGNMPIAGGDVWFKATFESLGDPTVHPRISLKGAGAGAEFQFEALKSCSKEAFNCGNEGTTGAKITEFEATYATDPDASDTGDPGGDGAVVPITLGTGDAVYIRVFRKGTASSCDGFTITISN